MSSSNYAKRMARLSARIFGEVVRPVDHKSKKVLRLFGEEPYYKNDRFVNYYPNIPAIEILMTKLRQYGLYRDEHKDFRDEMNRLRQKRGKPRWIPHKRGEKPQNTETD